MRRTPQECSKNSSGSATEQLRPICFPNKNITFIPKIHGTIYAICKVFTFFTLVLFNHINSLFSRYLEETENVFACECVIVKNQLCFVNTHLLYTICKYILSLFVEIYEMLRRDTQTRRLDEMLGGCAPHSERPTRTVIRLRVSSNLGVSNNQIVDLENHI